MNKAPALALIVLLSNSCMKKPEKTTFRNGATLAPVRQGELFGLQIRSNRDVLLATSRPIRIEVFDGEKTETVYSGYSEMKNTPAGFDAKAEVVVDGAKLIIADRWSLRNRAPMLSRTLTVEGNSSKAFMSAIEFEFAGHTRQEVGYFVPGMIYGSTDNLTPSAIGGKELYEKGGGALWIREDRMPAPLMAFRFDAGHSFSMLDTRPNGATTLADAHDTAAQTMVDENLRFGSFFAEHAAGVLKTGFAYPGSEGETTYQGNTYPGGQLRKWRKRYHPIKDGLVQEYALRLNSDAYPSFQSFYSTEYQLAFAELNPQVNHQDIELVRNTMLSILPGLAVGKGGKLGLPNWFDATDPGDKWVEGKAIFGFTGKNLEVAYLLLHDAEKHPGENSGLYKRTAYEIIASFLDLKTNPPVGEGYYIEEGNPALAIPGHPCIYLRSYGDGMKVLAKAYLLEKEQGEDNPAWLAWMAGFGNWALAQQYGDGGFPRAWMPGTGEVFAPSPASSYNMIPFFCKMHEITKEDKWLEAAIKTGNFSWESGQREGRFVGGTIDNPDVLDKEAGTLSLEAYLELFEATQDRKWLHRAEVAARFRKPGYISGMFQWLETIRGKSGMNLCPRWACSLSRPGIPSSTTTWPSMSMNMPNYTNTRATSIIWMSRKYCSTIQKACWPCRAEPINTAPRAGFKSTGRLPPRAEKGCTRAGSPGWRQATSMVFAGQRILMKSCMGN